MDNKLERLLSMQRNLQRSAFGYNFAQMNGDDRVKYITEQYVAAVKELGEALDEIEWKPWTTGPRVIHRDEFVNEMIDVLHIWINMMLSVSEGMSSTELGDEIFTRYALKNRTNAQRQTDGYDGRSTKCGGCGRALDDFAVECRRVGDQGYCAKTDSDINYLGVAELVVDEFSTTGELIVTPIKPVVCGECHHMLNVFGCEPPTTERWGNCMAGVGNVKNIPPIKVSNDS